MNDVQGVLIAEDDAPMRRELVALVRDLHPAAQVLEAASVRAALAQLSRRIDLALVDLGLADGSALPLLRQLTIQKPAAVSVVVTIYDDDDHIFPALQAGATGYLLKDAQRSAWRHQLGLLGEGVPALSPAIARRVLAFFRSHPGPAPEPEAAALTPRETEVLGLIGKGLRIGEVAHALGLRESTVAGYVKAIYGKLEISSRAEAALEAVRRGLA